MAYKETFPANGSQTDYAVNFPYLRREHISATVNGVGVPITWVNDGLVRLPSAPDLGAEVVIKRTTQRTPVVTLVDGKPIPASTYMLLAKQSLYVSEETTGGEGAFGALAVENNLSDVEDTDIALTNLGAGPAGIDLVKKATVAEIVQIGGAPTGHLSRLDGARLHKINDRLLGGAAWNYGAEWTTPALATGMPDITKALHSWVWRDSEFLWETNNGVAAITGYARSSTSDNYPGYPAFHPYGMGGQFVFVNDKPSPSAHGSAIYTEATRLNGSGFTVTIEAGLANYGSESTPTPFNMKTGGANGGVLFWGQMGNGQDRAYDDADLVKDSAAFMAFLTTGEELGSRVAWEAGKVYRKGQQVCEGYNGTKYVVRVAHTPPLASVFATYRAANPTYYALRKTGAYAPQVYNTGDLATDAISNVTFRSTTDYTATDASFIIERQTNPANWKQVASARAGIVVEAGALTELSPGSHVFKFLSMPERHLISWDRNNGGTIEQSAFIWSETIPVGSAPVGITFQQNLVNITAANGIRALATQFGGNANYATVARANGANDSLTITNPGTGVMAFNQGGLNIAYVRSDSFDLVAGRVYKVANTQVVGPRATGWTAASGVAGNKGAFVVAAAGTASAAYTQAELQGALNRVAASEARIRAIEEAARTHGLIN